MTVESFVRIVWTVFEKIEKRVFFDHFWVNSGYVCHIQSYDSDAFAHAGDLLGVE